jgi:hypothetical protein
MRAKAPTSYPVLAKSAFVAYPQIGRELPIAFR